MISMPMWGKAEQTIEKIHLSTDMVRLHNIVSMQCGRTVTIQHTCHYRVLYPWKEHWCIKCIWSLHIREKCSTCFVLFIIEKSWYRRGVFSFNWGLFYELNGSGYTAVPVYAQFYSPNICDSKEIPTDLNPLLNKTKKTVNKIKLWSCCLYVFSVLSEKITSHDCFSILLNPDSERYNEFEMRLGSKEHLFVTLKMPLTTILEISSMLLSDLFQWYQLIYYQLNYYYLFLFLRN